MGQLKDFRGSWGYPTTLLCVYGFFSTVKPIEPFLIPYLTGPDKNLTSEQVTNEVFPVWTYSYLAVLVPVFLLTDWLRYKPVVIFQACTLAATTSLLLWLDGVGAMQTMQFFYGMVTATEVAYYSYIYSVVELQHYLKATSYCRAAQLMGYTVGSVLGQLLVSLGLLSYYYILVFTLVLIAVALVVSLLLPMPQRSMFFHRKIVGVEEMQQEEKGKNGQEGSGGEGRSESGNDEPWRTKELNLGERTTQLDHPTNSTPSPLIYQNSSVHGPEDVLQASSEGQTPPASGGCVGVLLRLWRDFLQCYSSPVLLYWSVWWALATCGYNQTVNYVQVLWDHTQPSGNFTLYNGGVEAVSNLFGAATAYGIGFTLVDWHRWGELALGSFSGMGGGALFLMVFTGNIWVCYAGYVVFKCLYMLLITIAMFQIATGLSMERYALIFGANNFGALLLQTILTSVVVDSRGLGLGIVLQFIIYGSYFTAIAALFFMRGLYVTCKHTSAERPGEPHPRSGSRSSREPSHDTRQGLTLTPF
ncbi:thiamine transporter 2 [Denticeps clupeoides]|uniref:thiamine transporter 2 n=1 Tax=Denticeps clupeoides TaxID=299321 RepID=UPI0010A40540|nr:thiamine transporter 2-like [Denticeps clupeoides]